MSVKNKSQRKQTRQQRRKNARQLRREIQQGDLPTQFFYDADTPAELVAAGEGSEEDGPPKFKMMAYAGGKMMPRGFGLPVVVDLQGMTVLAGSRPIHFAHDQTRPVGHADDVSIKKSVRADVVLSVDNEDSRMIAESSRNGFPWRSSIGVSYNKIQFFDEGDSFKANNRTFAGPCYYVPKSSLFEISFVTVAGDNTSSARIAASRGSTTGEDSMFEQWLEAKGFDPSTITDDQRSFLQAMFDQEQAAASKPGTGDGGQQTAEAAATQTNTLLADANSQAQAVQSIIDNSRREMAAELSRQGDIANIARQYGNPNVTVDGAEVNLQAHAVENGWTKEATELAALRASRSTAPAIHTHSRSEETNANVLEAAARLSLGQDGDTLLAEYGEQTMDVADQYRNLGLRELAAFSCQVEGISVPRVWGDGRQTLRAAFTTQTLPNVLENVLNKTLLPIYDAMESIAMQIARVSRASDFKQVSNVRLLGSGAWEKVGADGELKHGRIGDEKFTNQAETYGQFMMLNHQTWKNDDLGALENMATYMAIMGNQIIEDEFFTILLANANNFVHANNSNLGAGVAFGPTGLGALKTLFRKQKKGPGSRSKNKRPVNIRPVKLLTPVEIEDDAASLLGTPNLIIQDRDTTATAAVKTGTKNPHFGKYELLSAPQVSDTAFTGNTSTGYWLFSDPRLLAAFDLIFVDGVTRPTIERVDPAPNTLGMGFRGYINFGVAQQDPLGVAYDAGA